jgi:hypothetical protein
VNPQQIGAFAYAAGVRSQSSLQAAIAIALAESGGNPNKPGDVGLQTAHWGPSLGLWQIRSVKSESGKGTVRDATRLKDPTFNAKSMYSISNGGKNWGPWTTWPLKAAAFMPVAIPAASSVITAKGVIAGAQAASDALTGAADGVVDAVTPDGLQDIGEGVRAANRWIADRNNWFRVAKAVGGGALLIGGLFLMTKPIVTGVAAGEVGKVVTKVIKSKG